MAKTSGIQSTFYNGISSQSVKLGKEASFGFSSGFDFRSEPTELRAVPRSVKISSSVVTDLPMSRDIAGDRLYFHGDTGNIYLVDDEDNVTLETQVSNSRGNGLAYLAEDGYLYIFKDTSIDRRQNATGTGSYFADFLENEGGVPTNTHSLELDGVDQYASRADTSSLSITGDLTLEACINTASLPGNGEVQTLISKWTEQNNNRSYKLDIVPPSDFLSLDLERSSSQYVYAADSSSIDITGDLTIELWLKLEQLPSTASGDFELVNKYRFTNNRSYRFYLASNNSIIFMYDQTGNNTITTTRSVSNYVDANDVGEWIHLAVTVDVSERVVKFYKNGVETEVAPGGDATAIFSGNARLAIGAVNVDDSPSSHTDGKIKEVRIWNTIRSAGQISANYQTELNGNESGLVAYYKFNNSLLDETANNNDLTGVNTPTYSTDTPFPSPNYYALRFSVSNDGSASEDYVQDVSVAQTAWDRVAVTWDASESEAKFYLNGSLIGTQTGALTSINDNSSAFAVGASFDSSGNAQDFYDGLIDDVRIWSDIRTASELDANKNRVLTGEEAGLVAYFNFDNDLEDDQASGNNDLTGTNSPTFSTDVPFAGVSSRGDEDVFLDEDGNTTTLKAALSESSADKIPFTPTKEPLKSIMLNIDTVGTGDWTVKVHDSLNREIATVTVENGDLLAGFYEFVFDEISRPVRNAEYHIHVYSTVADGKIVSSTNNDMSTAYLKTFYQVLVDSRFHPSIQFSTFLAIGNERYLATMEAGGIYDPHRLVFPSGYEVTAVSQWNEFVAVGVTRTNRDEGIVFFWDGASDTYSAPLYVPQGGINALYGIQDTLFIFAGNRGKLFRYTGASDRSSGGPAGKGMVEIPFKEFEDTIYISPYAVDMYQSIMRFGVGLDVESSNITRGIYSFGHKDSSFEMSLGFDNMVSTDSSIFVDQPTRIGSVIARDNKLYVGWEYDDDSFGIDAISPDNEKVDFPWFQTLLLDAGSVANTKLPLTVRADFLPLISGQYVKLYARFDRTGGFTEIGSQTQTGATHARATIAKRTKEFEIGVEARTGGDELTITGVGIENEIETGRAL